MIWYDGNEHCSNLNIYQYCNGFHQDYAANIFSFRKEGYQLGSVPSFSLCYHLVDIDFVQSLLGLGIELVPLSKSFWRKTTSKSFLYLS